MITSRNRYPEFLGSKEQTQDAIDTREVGKKAIRQDKIERAGEEIGFYAGEIRALEYQFRKQLDRSKERGELHIDKEEFSKWEQDYRYLWLRVREQVQRNGLTSAEEATAEQKIIVYTEEADLATTVEAQAGNFFTERERNLLSAIREQGGNEEDLKVARGFAEAVDDHLDFKYMSPDEIRDYGYDNYESHRTIAHNNAIKQLNNMNRLAEKYGTERFTPRDFWTSEMPKSAQTPAIARRMRFDRDIVEEYYGIAFRSEAKRREAKLKREMGLI